MMTINIANEFSPFPAGRYISDGPFSGEKFRDGILLPALKANAKVCIIFDGAFGYGSSFLEEAFGGLVRLGLDKEDVLKKLVFISKEDPFLESEVVSYIEEAGGR